MDVPGPIVDRVRGTVAEDLFFKYKTLRRDTGRLCIKTGASEFKLVIPTETSFERTIREKGIYEPVLVSELLSIVDHETVYYDVGSRWGFFTKMAAEVGSGMNVHGFEANPSWFSILSDNHSQDAVHLTNSFVADRPGRRAMTIDGYRDNHNPPTVVKVDVEGAEEAVLRGMESTLRAEQPRMYLEIHPQYLQDRGSSARGVFEILESHDYSVDVSLRHREDEGEWIALDEAATLPDVGEYLIRAT